MERATGTMLADLVRHGTGVPATGPLTTTLLGSGASLLLTRGRRPVGLVLLAAGAALLWVEARAAARIADAGIKPARPGPPGARPPLRAGASAAAA